MRGHVRRAGLARSCLRPRFLVSLATLGAILAVTPWAQARDAAEETITLAGRRLRAWDQGSTRWVILDGQAAIFQGTEGLRADRAVVQITETAAGHRLTIYVEAGKDQSPSRRVLETRAPIRLTRYQGRGVGPSHAGESHDRELVARAFPEALSTLSAMERPEVPGHSPPRSFTQIRAQAPDEPEPRPTPEAPRDERVRRTQEPEPAFPELPAPPDIGTPFTPFPDVPQLETPGSGVGELLIPQPPTTLEPLPGEAEVNPPIESPLEIPALPAPIVPGSQRIVNIFLRRNAADAQFQRLPTTENGTDIFVVTGGVTVVAESYGRFGTIDVSADNAIIWTRLGQGGGGPDGVRIVQDANQPLELYLEGNVIFRQDERKVAGHGDEKLIEARQFYMDLRSQRFTALDGQYDQFVADFVAPIRTQGRRIQQFKEEYRDAEGRTLFGPARIQVDRTLTTGSRFPKPGYRFLSRSVDLTEQAPTLLTDPVTGAAIGSKDDPNAPRDSRYLIDARQNLFFIGPIPVFYWPRLVTTSDDIDPPLRRIQFRADNVFGQQLLTDWSGFKLLGLKRPANHVDQWNIDIDYLSYRGLAGGSEFGYFGKDFSKEILGVDLMPRIQGSYFGYIDMWGLRDWGIDNLGNGPAILNNTPATNQIFFRNAVPPLQDFRGRIIARHMHSFNAIDADPLDDTRLQLEFGYLSDRNFLEEYYKRLFDTGMDQATLLYFIRQRQNRAFTFHVEPNLQNFYTDSQWLPKLDYYRLGDAPLWRLFTYYQHSGVNWSNTHTAIEVNNPNVFTFLPLDPVSNTSGPYQSFRAYTAHELDLPINLGFVRLTPYVQGQLVGWTDQLDFEERGRVWGAAGGRLNVFAWKAWPGIESELLNLHGLAHKASFDVDYRTTYADQPLGQLAIQDDLDDNTYEFVRRYFAMTQYVGALLPAQYDPRFLTLRRTISPITGTVDIQDSIETLRLETHQRIQTKRGLEGARRVIDYMTLDIGTTYFPNADRDNFGTPFGQTTYNFEWYLGDRTSFVSSGWFEYFDITGRQLLRDASRPVDAQGINVINAGILVNRPPRGNIYAGYYIINTGPINTSALNGAFGYWLSPKWYGSVSLSYDFGNQILLGTSGSITRVGADFLTSIGLTVDPQRQMYTFGFEIVPRLSPNLRLGSASSGIGRFDSRFAPYE